ncbi:MAG: precorrin-2 C(20)-methyltransferase [Eubacteriales bacterium]|nr:precorrin-2 C(20)-methyltransferase [Eubacteriales bacterium]
MNNENKKGILYGVGVGPGDPELITLKAMRTIEAADVLILPAADRESCRAYKIAEGAFPEISRKDCRFFPFPMTMKREMLDKFHAEISADVCEMLESGKNAAFITIGDPGIYSTFGYIRKLVSEAGYETRTVSGVPSFAACAASLGLSLSEGSEEIHVIPGSGDIEEALKLKGTKVFMKSGKRLKELKQRLMEIETGSNETGGSGQNGGDGSFCGALQVYSVSDCGFESECCGYSAADIPDDAGYLTVVIVK